MVQVFNMTYKHGIRDHQTRQEKSNLHYFRQLDVAVKENVRLCTTAKVNEALEESHKGEYPMLSNGFQMRILQVKKGGD